MKNQIFRLDSVSESFRVEHQGDSTSGVFSVFTVDLNSDSHHDYEHFIYGDYDISGLGCYVYSYNSEEEAQEESRGEAITRHFMSF